MFVMQSSRTAFTGRTCLLFSQDESDADELPVGWSGSKEVHSLDAVDEAPEATNLGPHSNQRNASVREVERAFDFVQHFACAPWNGS